MQSRLERMEKTGSAPLSFPNLPRKNTGQVVQKWGDAEAAAPTISGFDLSPLFGEMGGCPEGGRGGGVSALPCPPQIKNTFGEGRLPLPPLPKCGAFEEGARLHPEGAEGG